MFTILGGQKLEWRSSSFQAKVIGSLISIMGAIMVELYQGTEMLKTSVSSPYILQFKQQFFIFSSTPEYWVLGGILLAATSLSCFNMEHYSGTTFWTVKFIYFIIFFFTLEIIVKWLYSLFFLKRFNFFGWFIMVLEYTTIWSLFGNRL